MAATKIVDLDAKQAKQKKILIVAAVMLVALLAFQLPKLMGGDSTPAAAPAASTAADTAPSTAGSSTAAAATAAAETAPASFAGTAAVKAGKAQLASFSLFETKDPFVQQIKDASAKGGSGAASTTKGAGSSAKGGSAKNPVAGPGYATISVNGEPEALQVKAEFPVDDPLFRLVGLTDKAAKIGIAGGSLTDGATVTLRKGKKLTLVNTATGARYTLDLLYTGTTPEETATFTAGDGTADVPATTTSATAPVAP